MPKKAQYVSVVLALTLGGGAAAQHAEIHCKHFLYGYPAGAPASNDLIIRDVYALSSNDSRKLADWVAYRIDASTVDGPKVSRKWRADPWLDAAETLEPNDYKAAHATLKTDRGHQAPLAAFRGTGLAQETNFLSNITPQKSNLNQGPWERLESKVRALTEHYDVYVMTGPAYERNMPGLPRADETHSVPSGYWKIIAVEEGSGESGLKISAFFFDQDTARDADICDHQTTVSAVEQKSGLDFFWELEDTLETEIEAGQQGAALAEEHFGCS